MSTNYNRIKVSGLETNQPDKILITNSNGELEFNDINKIVPPNSDPVSATQSGIVDNTSLHELGGKDKLVNGVRIGEGTGTGNTVLGKQALQNSTTGSNNTGVGEEVLAMNTNGSDNTAFGNWALRSNTTGSYNDAFGENALTNNTNGAANAAFGNGALSSNVISSYNTASGNSSMTILTSGLGQSVAVGAFCMSDATGTDKNTAVGTYALHYNSLGYSNTTVGYSSLTANTTGYANTAMGKFTGRYVTTGNNNIYIGAEGEPSDASANGIVNIGNKIISNADNLVFIPQQTNTLIEADSTGKAVVTKEYVLEKLNKANDQLEISSSQNIQSNWHGKTILFTANCTITVPASLASSFIFNGIRLPGVSVIWAITAPHTWLFGTPPITAEKQIFTFTKRGNTNSILLLGI